MAHERCRCGHQRASHVNGLCATCRELGEIGVHEYEPHKTADPRVRPLTPAEIENQRVAQLEEADDQLTFYLAPPRVLGEIKVEPPDAQIVFVVEAGWYDERKILGTFVGNRVLAHIFRAEHDRYGQRDAGEAEVTEFRDLALGQHRAIRTPNVYTQLKRVTLIRNGTASREPNVFHQMRTKAKVDTTGCGHDLYTEVHQVDSERVEIVTRSPDYRHEEALTQHMEFVNKWLKSEDSK